jgi:hypothetical protein
MRKIVLVFLVVSFSAAFSISAGAQQENLNDKIFELQEQWKRIMLDEYNPSAVQPKAGGRSLFGSAPFSGKRARKPASGKPRPHAG